MTDLNLFTPEDFDLELLKDFQESLAEELQEIENALFSLEKSPTDKELIHALFRSVHSIKGNARMCYLNPMTTYLHAIEEMLSEFRTGHFGFSSKLSEALLLSLDHFKIKVDELMQNGSVDIALMDRLAPYYVAIKTASASQFDENLSSIINQFRRQLVGDGANQDAEMAASEIEPELINPDPVPTLAAHLDIESFDVFATLAKQVEERVPFWEDRSSQQLSIALRINSFLPVPVDNDQLRAAILIHDVGMGFLPDSLLNKTNKYNALEEKKVRKHVNWSYQWLVRIPGFEDAATMVYQHHERPDGRGYPQGISGPNIHVGAQIIAITDTFYSITNQRSDRAMKKSLMRAITEINSYRDVQFSGEVVDAFNQLVRQLYASARQEQQ